MSFELMPMFVNAYVWLILAVIDNLYTYISSQKRLFFSDHQFVFKGPKLDIAFRILQKEFPMLHYFLIVFS